MIAATDWIIRHCPIDRKTPNWPSETVTPKEWGLERKKRKCIQKGIEAATIIINEKNHPNADHTKLMCRVCKACTHVPGTAKEITTNKTTYNAWSRKCRNVKTTLSRSMQRLKTKERKRRIDTPGHRQAASRWAAGWHPGCREEAATQEVARWWPRGSQVVAKRLAGSGQPRDSHMAGGGNNRQAGGGQEVARWQPARQPGGGQGSPGKGQAADRWPAVMKWLRGGK